MPQRNRNFTFLEVVAAAMILVLALTAALTAMTNAQQRMALSRDSWHRQHMMTQAAEFFLLAGPGAPPDPRFFPYPGVEVSCHMLEAEGLPGEFPPIIGEWQLNTMHLELRFPDGGTETLSMDRIVKGGMF